MSFYPLHEILFFIALFFAPEGTTEFQIAKESDNPFVFQLTEKGWMNSTENKIWREDRNTVKHGDESHNVSEFVEGIAEHSWSEESILHLGLTDVLKTKNGIVYYPNGIEYPKNKYTITYQTGANQAGDDNSE